MEKAREANAAIPSFEKGIQGVVAGVTGSANE